MNPDHPIISRLRLREEIGGDAAELGDVAHLLLEQALLAAGLSIADPLSMAGRINRLMERNM